MARRTGRSGSVSGKGTGRSRAARSGRSTGRARAAAQRRGGGQDLVPVICSECFEDFAFDTRVQTDSLECPICEHSANRPDDGTLHRITGLRKAERTNFLISFALFGVSALSFMAWTMLMENPLNAEDGAMFWGPIGVGGLSALVLAVFIFKYEGSRWETYF